MEQLSDRTLVQLGMCKELLKVAIARQPKMTGEGVGILRYRLPAATVRSGAV